MNLSLQVQGPQDWKWREWARRKDGCVSLPLSTETNMELPFPLATSLVHMANTLLTSASEGMDTSNSSSVENSLSFSLCVWGEGEERERGKRERRERGEKE